MKLTKHHSLDVFSIAVRNAALQNAADAGCPDSYAGAFGGVQHLLFTICQKHPKALSLVNDYLSRYEVKTAERANPAHKETLEKHHAAVTAAINAAPEHQLESWEATPDLKAEMVELATRLLNQELDIPAPALPEPQAAPCATIDPTAGKYAHLWGGPEVPPKPTAESPADTSPDARPAQAMHLASPDAATHPSSGHAPEPLFCTPSASLHCEAKAPSAPMSIHAELAHPVGSPAACGAVILPLGSSSQSGDSCGDIHCKGTCPPAAAPAMMMWVWPHLSPQRRRELSRAASRAIQAAAGAAVDLDALLLPAESRLAAKLASHGEQYAQAIAAHPQAAERANPVHKADLEKQHAEFTAPMTAELSSQTDHAPAPTSAALQTSAMTHSEADANPSSKAALERFHDQLQEHPQPQAAPSDSSPSSGAEKAETDEAAPSLATGHPSARTPARGPQTQSAPTPLADPIQSTPSHLPASPPSSPGECSAVPVIVQQTNSDGRSSSSAQCGEACGDIHCKGTCQPAAAPDLRPPLIVLIDQCGSVINARRKLCDASEAARRAAARYLHTDMHSLPAVIIRRVRERLLAA